MTVLTVRQSGPARLAFERLQQQMGLMCGDDFTACRQLIALVEAVAPSMSELDRRQLSRIMSSTGHSILLSCDKRS